MLVEEPVDELVPLEVEVVARPDDVVLEPELDEPVVVLVPVLVLEDEPLVEELELVPDEEPVVTPLDVVVRPEEAVVEPEVLAPVTLPPVVLEPEELLVVVAAQESVNGLG